MKVNKSIRTANWIKIRYLTIWHKLFIFSTFFNIFKEIVVNIFLYHNFNIKRNCIEFALKAKPFRRYIPKQRFQYKIWWLVTSQPFEYAIFTLILINTITLGMKFDGQPKAYTDALDILNSIFTGAFALECFFKLAAFRFKVLFLLYITFLASLYNMWLHSCLQFNWNRVSANSNQVCLILKSAFKKKGIFYSDYWSPQIDNISSHWLTLSSIRQ